jgi:hypothetical protein
VRLRHRALLRRYVLREGLSGRRHA